MDTNLVFAKTPIGDEAVRQSTRVVQRNLRMVLVQVDGKMSVAELTSKIGNPRLVESALRELEKGGFIAPTVAAVSVWEESKKAANQEDQQIDPSVMSEFSTFGPKSLGLAGVPKGQSTARNFSSFGKPLLPAASSIGGESLRPNVAATENTPEREYRPYKLQVSVGHKWISFAVVSVVILICTVIFYPYGRFKPAIEASATQLLKTPVRIDQVGVVFFPNPVLKLSGVHIGESLDSSIAEIRISSPLSLLGNGPYQIPVANVSGANIAAHRLVAFPMLMEAVSDDPVIVIRKIRVDQFRVILGENLTTGDLNGELAFRANGSLEKASLETVDRSLLIGALPDNQGIALNIAGQAWQPTGTSVSVASLQAKGLLRKDRLLIQNIDSTFLGGILRGNWLLEWGNGLAMAGDGTLSRLDSRRVSAAFAPSLKLEGDMSGTIRLRSTGRDWDSLWGNLEAVLTSEITHGVLHGVDLGEAARRGGVSEVRAGATKFEHLFSTVNIAPRQVAGRDVRMDAGMVTAVGQFVSGRNGQVDANMAVTLQTSVASQTAPVRIFGILPDLSATTRK